MFCDPVWFSRDVTYALGEDKLYFLDPQRGGIKGPYTMESGQLIETPLWEVWVRQRPQPQSPHPIFETMLWNIMVSKELNKGRVKKAVKEHVRGGKTERDGEVAGEFMD